MRRAFLSRIPQVAEHMHTILIIDPSPTGDTGLVSALAARGYRVLHAPTTDAGVEMAVAQPQPAAPISGMPQCP